MNATITSSVETTNPLQELRKFGQSAWLDYIRRSLITGGELKRDILRPVYDSTQGAMAMPLARGKRLGGSSNSHRESIILDSRY